jgi:iron complex transport system substrate-binding protein
LPSNSVAKKGVEVKDAGKQTVTINDSSRIVSIGTAVTETIYALDAGSRVIAVDNASGEYIKESSQLPKVGARNALSAEGILSLKPSLVVLTADSQPQTAIDQIKNTGITVLTLPADSESRWAS